MCAPTLDPNPNPHPAQVMMAERNRRGIKAEMEESREILEAYVEVQSLCAAICTAFCGRRGSSHQ